MYRLHIPALKESVLIDFRLWQIKKLTGYYSETTLM